MVELDDAWSGAYGYDGAEQHSAGGQLRSIAEGYLLDEGTVAALKLYQTDQKADRLHNGFQGFQGNQNDWQGQKHEQPIVDLMELPVCSFLNLFFGRTFAPIELLELMMGDENDEMSGDAATQENDDWVQARAIPRQQIA